MSRDKDSQILQSFKKTLNSDVIMDSNAKHMYEEVVRKDYEIIKHFLSKMSDVYNRQEQYEAHIKNLNDQITKITESNENFHYQFRTTYLELERKQLQFGNDILGIKNLLKIPASNTPFQAYLSSSFFKEQSSRLNGRQREGRTRTKKRHKTNFDYNNPNQQKMIVADVEISNNVHQRKLKPNRSFRNRRAKNISDLAEFVMDNENDYIDIESNYSHDKERESLQEHENKPSHSNFKNQFRNSNQEENDQNNSVIEGRINSVFKQLEQTKINLKGQLQNQNSQISAKIKVITQSFQAKIVAYVDANGKKQCDWNHIDFDELQRYIDEKIKEQFYQKVNKKYFQQSMSNLKDAWQQQLKEVYSLIDQKAKNDQLLDVQTKLQQLIQQQQQLLNLNSIKIQNISFNSTCKSTPYKSTTKENAIDRESIVNVFENKSSKEMEPRGTRHTLTYSNSLSLLRGFQEKKQGKFFKNPIIDEMKDQTQVFQKKWKNKVNESLGVGKKKIHRGKTVQI